MRCRPLVLAAALLSFGCEPPRPTNVVVVLVDTLRSDHLGCYGYSRDTSPNIDRLASSGYVFDAAIAQSSWTAPSVASLFTSLYPSVHGVVRWGSTVAPELETLAEVLQKRGLKTAGFSANMAFVNPEKGFDQGFDVFEVLTRRARADESKEKIFGKVASEASTVTDRAIRHLDEVGGQPFFLYVHYIDPHTPYNAPAPYRERFVTESVGVVRKSHDDLFAISGTISAGDDDVPHLIELYDGEIAYTDAQIGRLLGHLEDAGLMERTLVVITSDHGEEFLEHRGWVHGTTLYREQVQVPLIVRMPDGAGGGRRIAEPIELVDVGPSLLEQHGAPDHRRTQGHSFASLMLPDGGFARLRRWFRSAWKAVEAPHEDSPSRANAFSELVKVTKDAREPRHAKALRSERWSYLLDGSGADELFDNADTAQADDLSSSQPGVATEMNRTLLDVLKRSEAFGELPTQNETLSDEQREKMRALGYVE
ncbi:MAG: sulfatase [Candidatus Binatia bacterium]